jgi:poly-gamma-glutamate capsule biosynthesis protein CapA/YwtB (metallophosphatase superfamily)
VAVASGQIRDGGAATDTRPGVNEARRIPGSAAVTGLDEADIARALAAVTEATKHADLVIMYHHNHFSGPKPGRPPDWQQALAHRCIDAGAAMFVSHGEPPMLGVELYRGEPIFYDLGSLIFQTATEAGHYDAAVWQSVIAECRFDGARFLGATLTPVQMNATGIGGADDLATRGRPLIATGEDAASILALLARLSSPFGTRLREGKLPGTGEIVV